MNVSHAEDHQWVTMKEAAARLGVSPSTISRLAAINAIEEVKQKRANRRSKFVNLEQVRRALEEKI